MNLSLLRPAFCEERLLTMEEKPFGHGLMDGGDGSNHWSSTMPGGTPLRNGVSSPRPSPMLQSLSSDGPALEESLIYSRPDDGGWPEDRFNDQWNQPPSVFDAPADPSQSFGDLSGFMPNYFDPNGFVGQHQRHSGNQSPSSFPPGGFQHHPNVVMNPFDYPISSFPYSPSVNSSIGTFPGSSFQLAPYPPQQFPSHPVFPQYTSFAMPNKKPERKPGGRKPRDGENTRGMSKEEKEKRDLRRERNKQAAARCRQRRQNKLDTLQEEVNGLEKVTGDLSQEIKHLEAQKAELAMILESHKSFCKLDPSQLPMVGEQSVSVQNSSCFGDEFRDGHNDLNVQLNETVVGVDLEYKEEPSCDEPRTKRFKQEPQGNRNSPEAKVRPSTLGLGLRTTDMGHSVFMSTATPSLGLSTDTPSKLVFQCDPLVTELLKGSTGMTPINPAIQPFWETSSMNTSLDTPVNPSTESVAGSNAGTTTSSSLLGARSSTLLEL